jgi:hypothetical protein
MSASVTSAPSTSTYATPAFWERLWRASGLFFVVLFIVAYGLGGYLPGVGASADVLAAFYGGARTRILIASVLSGMALLNLLWFAAAIRATLADTGRDGWGAAVTAASTLFGALFLLLVSVVAALAFSIAGTGNQAMMSGLNDLAWACVVLSSFPRAMLIMAGSFGFWRAGMISNALFGACVAAVVLVLLGATTWMSSGMWAPDGAYSRLVSPIIGLVWVLVASWIVLARAPGSRSSW